MKILMVAPTPFFADRGTHIRILEEALALEKLGHEITISTYHIGKDVHEEIETNIDVRRIRRLLFWYKKLEAGPDWQKIFLDIMLIRKTFYLARTKKPDIIHAHLHEGALIGRIVQKLLFWRKMKLVFDSHGSLVKEMTSHDYLKGGLLKKMFDFMERRIDNLGEYVISSSWENTEKIKRTRKKDSNVETVLDGVNIEHYIGLLDKNRQKKDLDLPEDKIIATYTGALVPNKGVKYLEDAILDVTRKTDDIYFVVAGFPIDGMKKFVLDNKLEAKVRLINPLNFFDLPKILNASDIAIDPKDSETSQASGKILQYMAAGLPIVCFDKQNNRKYLGEGAYYATEFSGKGIAEGIIYFFRDRRELFRRGEMNKRKVTEFSWALSAKKIEEIYEKIGVQDKKKKNEIDIGKNRQSF